MISKLSPPVRNGLFVVAGIAVILLIWFLWTVMGPGPTGFAGGTPVGLAPW
jgi:hypothetical protein